MKDEDIKAIRDDLKTVGDQIRAQAEISAKEGKRLGEMTGETRAKVDELLTQQGTQQARLQAAEQLIVKLESGGSQRERGRIQTPGDVVAQHEALAQLRAAGVQVGASARIAVRAAVTSDSASAGDLLVPQYDGLVAPVRRKMTIRDLCGVGRTNATSVIYVKETGFTNNAAPVSENPGSAKPSSSLTYNAETAHVTTIAHIMKLSKQILDDAPALASEVNAAMQYGLKYKEELQLLLGSGVGLNINGIYTQATPYSNPGVNVQTESGIDRLRLALLQAALAEYDADGIILNPIDWCDIELTKDTQNRYLFANPMSIAQPALWGRPVVTTQAMTANEFCVGAFKLATMVYDREDMNVVIATQNEDDFIKNMVTVRCEERLALAVKRPEAIVKGNFNGVESE